MQDDLEGFVLDSIVEGLALEMSLEVSVHSLSAPLPLPWIEAEWRLESTHFLH